MRRGGLRRISPSCRSCCVEGLTGQFRCPLLGAKRTLLEPCDCRVLTELTFRVALTVWQIYAIWVARSTYTDLQRKRVRRYRDRAKRFRASAAKTKKRTDRPALIQLAQLCDILADGIEAQLRADADQCPLSGVKRT